MCGMFERRDRAGFAVETIAELRVGSQPFGEYFDRDNTVEPRVARAIDFAHSADAGGGKDFVRAEASAGL